MRPFPPRDAQHDVGQLQRIAFVLADIEAALGQRRPAHRRNQKQHRQRQIAGSRLGQPPHHGPCLLCQPALGPDVILFDHALNIRLIFHLLATLDRQDAY